MVEPGVEDVTITLQDVELPGLLGVPGDALGVVLFAHGSGSSRLSPRNTYVARVLREAGVGTLLFDLLTRQEDQIYATRFDIKLLVRRLVEVTGWLQARAQTAGWSLGYFGASTGSAAALYAAAELDGLIHAVVSRGGRPDLAMDALPRVTAPTLLLVGGADPEVLVLNRQAFEQLTSPKLLRIIPGATHLFEEPGTLESVAHEAAAWFQRYLPAAAGEKAA